MLHRRRHARHHVLAALLLTVSLGAALSACGAPPTDRINQIAAGANNRDGDIDLLGIRVLSTAPGEGRIIGSLSNQLLDESITLTGVTNTDGDAFTPGFQSYTVDADSAVNLSADGGLPVTGDFEAGDVLPLEFTFDDGETHELRVPVVKDCYQYTSVPTPSASESASGSSGKGDGADDTESASPSAESSSAGDLYECSTEESAPPTSGEGE